VPEARATEARALIEDYQNTPVDGDPDEADAKT